MQVGQEAAQQGVHVIYCDLENGVEQIMQRSLQVAKIIKAENPDELQEKVKKMDVEMLKSWAENFFIYGSNEIIDADSIKSKIPKT